MKKYLLLTTVIFLMLLSACSGNGENPISPDASNPQDQSADSNAEFTPAEASDVLYSRASMDNVAYKAFGIYQVIIDPVSLTGEIIPARNALAIGDTFDADLTQFLTVTPCANCLQIDGINLLPDNQVQVGFAVKHPFADITTRPDLHGFDVRGIVIANGNYNFPLTIVMLSELDFASARANVSLVANADGYTHHFDGLVADPNYFDPPRDFNANINPFKSYFIDGTTPDFDPHAPSGHNVMPTGADWETQDFTFNIGIGSPIEFAFVVDCAYGHSATYENRDTPYYFLPEYNRKEAWKVDVSIVTNDLQSGDTGSTAQLAIEVCDWQAGLDADPEYPNPDNMDGISAVSDVASVSVEMTNVSAFVQSDTPDSGSGTAADPYSFTLTVTNTEGVAAGYYNGIVAVRDDLQGLQGPMGIPENPNGFPFEGPEIYDYSVYQLFTIRVHGSAPVVNSIEEPVGVFENDTVQLSATVSEVDGDDVNYRWEQIAPPSPLVSFIDPTLKDAQFVAPSLYDIPIGGLQFTLRLTATDIDGEGTKNVVFNIQEYNDPPICVGIDTQPYLGVVGVDEDLTLTIDAQDPDGDALNYAWDFDYDGIIFNEDDTGAMVTTNWTVPGFLIIACRISEDRSNSLEEICSRIIVVRGFYDTDIKVDHEDEPDPNFYDQDVANIGSTFHAAWVDKDDYFIYYGNNRDDHDIFSNHSKVASDALTGWRHDPKVIGFGSTVMVIWVEYDTDQVPFLYSLKMARSTNYGDSWAGPYTITTRDSPDNIGDFDVCNGLNSSTYFIFYEAKETAQIKNYVLRSTDSGVTWEVPPGGGQFRDVFGVGDYVAHPQIGIGDNGILLTLWLDAQVSPARFLMDWSDDDGKTWHTDIIAAATIDNFVGGAMSLADDGSGYIALLRDTGSLTIYRLIFSTEPDLIGLISMGAGADSIDLYVSDSGNTAIVTYAKATGITAYYTTNGGTGWGYLWSMDHSTGDTYNVVCDGLSRTSPNRVEFFYTWVDNRGAAGSEAHIYGNFMYVPDYY